MAETLTHDKFWRHLEDVPAGMLNVTGGRPIPMSHYIDRNEETIWFITAKGTDLASGLRDGAAEMRYVIASRDGRLYANIEGIGQLTEDPAKLDEIWNVVADAWFEGGERDPDVQLVRFDLSDAEVWATNGGLSFLYEIAKAQVTDDLPDMGAHGRLKFAA